MDTVVGSTTYLQGTVLYFSPVDLSLVNAGDIFIDGSGNKYEIQSVGTIGSYTLRIKNVGTIPPTYPTSIHGAYPE